MSESTELVSRNARARRFALDSVCRDFGQSLDVLRPADVTLDSIALLATIAWTESTFGRDGGQSRVERAYRPDGIYYRRSATVRDLHNTYGDAAASSWSSFQILYAVAWELGFRGEPWKLYDDRIAVAPVVSYISERAYQRNARTVEEVARTYNGGNPAAEAVAGYVPRFVGHYQDSLTRLFKGLPLDGSGDGAAPMTA